MVCLQLRVKDIDFGYRQITVPLFQILTKYERSGLLYEPDNQLNLFT